MTEIEDLYEQRKNTPYSLNEHMNVLREYASTCDIVVEFGTYTGFSAIAFLAAQPKELHCYDVLRQPDISLIEDVASRTSTKFVFHHQSSLSADFESADLLFFDSLHCYNQLRQELELHAHKISKYLVFHDFLTYAYADEAHLGDSGMPTDYECYSKKHRKGIAPAIGEYMEEHKEEWQIHEIFYHQSGLCIYKRKSEWYGL